MANIGKVKQIIGPVVDVSFAGTDSKLPEILNALVIKREESEEEQQAERGRVLGAPSALSLRFQNGSSAWPVLA